jgi:hypothetical protein
MLTYLDLTKGGLTDSALNNLRQILTSDPPRLIDQAGAQDRDSLVAPRIVDTDPPVLFEGIFCSDSNVGLGFTVFNSSEEPGLVSAVDFCSDLFDAAETPGTMRFRSGAPRTVLSVNFDGAGSIKNGSRVIDSADLGSANRVRWRRTNLLGADRVVRIEPHSSESFMLFLNDEIRTDSEGFMYLFRVELLLGLPRKAPLRVNLDQIFEASRSPAAARIQLRAHPEPVAGCLPDLLTDGRSAKEEVRELSKAIKSSQFSDVVLYKLAKRLQEAGRLLEYQQAYLDLAVTASESLVGSVFWNAALLEVLKSQLAFDSPGLKEVALLIHSAYDERIRLRAARLTAGLPGSPRYDYSQSHPQMLQIGEPAFNSLRDECIKIINSAPQNAGRRSRTSQKYPEADRKSEAIWSLAELGDKISLRTLAELCGEGQGNHYIREHAIEAIGRMSGQEFLPFMYAGKVRPKVLLCVTALTTIVWVLAFSPRVKILLSVLALAAIAPLCMSIERIWLNMAGRKAAAWCRTELETRHSDS